MDFRKTYHAIPEQFDKWRPRYCNELFDDVIEYAKIDDSKSVLEIGPGTGQATEPFLKTGCDYLAIELRENFVDFTKNKNYGFIDYNYRDWKSTRAYNADEYVEYLASTQVEHITLQEHISQISIMELVRL